MVYLVMIHAVDYVYWVADGAVDTHPNTIYPKTYRGPTSVVQLTCLSIQYQPRYTSSPNATHAAVPALSGGAPWQQRGLLVGAGQCGQRAWPRMRATPRDRGPRRRLHSPAALHRC